MRKIYYQDGHLEDTALPVKSGGIGDVTAPKGCKKIGLVSYDQDMTPLGIINLDEGGVVPKKALPGEVGDPSIPALEGNFTVTAAYETVFTITNYDAFTSYTMSVSAGTITQVIDKITFLAPNVAGSAKLTINGKEFTITIGVPIPNTPSIVTPSVNEGLVSLGGAIVSTPFSIVKDIDTHFSSDWEVSTDPGFGTLALSLYETTTKKLSLDVASLTSGVLYYVRTRHRGAQSGVSAWSGVRSFTTSGWFQRQKTYPLDASGGQVFGAAVAMNSDATIALIGAYGDSTKATNAGAAYVFTRTGNVWTQQQKLFAGDAVAYDYFGASAALNSDATIALIGAHCDDDLASNAGCVYVFTRSGDVWTQQQKLHASDYAADDYFGVSVALNSDATIALIGACGDDDRAAGAGSVYVFTRSGDVWTQQQKLYALDFHAGYGFGYSTALNTDATYALIGARADADKATDAGAVYVFTRVGTVWTYQTKLYSSLPVASAYFGNSVALNGDATIALVSSLGDAIKGAASGAIYTFLRTGSTWKQVSKSYASDALPGYGFGGDIALSSDGTKLLVGCENDAGKGTGAGSLYYYENSKLGIEGCELGKYFASDPIANDFFSEGISISGDGLYAAVGAPNKDDKATNAGCVYIYTRSGNTWVFQTKVYSSSWLADDNFGISCCLNTDGSYLIVGAYGDDATGDSAGAAYIFTRSGISWTQQAKLYSSDAYATHYLGISVAINGDGTYALVGAHGDDYRATDAGAVYGFSRTGNIWTQQAKFYANDATASARFGSSCSISADGLTSVIGAYLDSLRTASGGAAYVFARVGDVWTQQVKIYGSDVIANDHFALGVAISGNGSYIAIGAEASRKANGAGSLYIYRNEAGAWIEVLKLYASDATASYRFARSLSYDYSGNRLLAGSEGDSTKASSAGAFYMLT